MKEKINALNKINLLKWSLLFVLMFLLQNAVVGNDLRPFAYAMLFALVWCNQNIFMVAVCYLGSALLCDFSINSALFVGATILIFVFFYFMHYKFNKPLNVLLIIIYSFFSQLPFMLYYLVDLSTLFDCFFYCILGTVFLFACLIFFQNLLLKKYRYDLSIDTIVCGSVFLIAVCMGLATFEFANISFLQLVAVCVLFFSTFVLKGLSAILLAVVMGLGGLLNNGDTSFVILFTCYALSMLIFMDRKPYFSLIATLLIDIFARLYLLNDYYSFESVAVICVAFIAYMLIPKKYSSLMYDFFEKNKQKIVLKNIANRNRELMHRRLIEVREVFYEMSKVFKNMCKGSMSDIEATQILAQELVQNLCSDCPNKNNCLRFMGQETLLTMQDMLSIAISRGRLTIVDVPAHFISRCQKTNLLIGMANNLIIQYKKNKVLESNLDSSKLMIGEQLGGVSKIINELANEFENTISFDANLEKELIEELSREDINCNEAVIYKDKNDTILCTLLIQYNEVYGAKISDIVSKICKIPVYIARVESSCLPFLSVVYLKNRPKYDLIYGVAQISKNGNDICGDAHSMIRINDEKILLAICDGMGNGERANRASGLAISMIENFYKAGFANDIILNSVNKLLALSSNEVFSALDIGVLDLRQGYIDLIKIGASIGFVKSKIQTEIVEAGSLPIGILENLNPSITKRVISHGDMIILMSDGIVDSFENHNVLFNFINTQETINPQIMADKILEQSLINDKQSPNDDMTVIVARIIGTHI